MLSADDRILYQGYLAEARDALHRLQTGSLEVMINMPGGRSATYQSVKAAELRAYIVELETKLGLGRRRAFSPYFRG